MDRKTKTLIEGILKAAEDNDHPFGGAASEACLASSSEGPVKNFQDATKSDLDKFGRWHRGMLERGVYLAPSQYEAGFTSMKHSDKDIGRPSKWRTKSWLRSKFSY